MSYLNDEFDKYIVLPPYKDKVEIVKEEVDEFMANFHDSPEKRSEWGHYYFCDHDGGRLIFDINKPHEHKCSVCGKEFKSEVFDGVWVYFYRNLAVLTAWKSAFLYKALKEKKYLNYVKQIISFYALNYTKFVIHNKERETFNSYDEMKWGCGRILPQGLNESIILIRLTQALEIVKNDLDEEFLNIVSDFFHEAYKLLKPQVNLIHNIRCWNLSAIGIMGFFINDKEMIDFVFNSEFNIRKQINTGVTKDYFWYEGSIHYNFFTLEGITSLLLFSKIYNYDFGKKEEEIIEQMFVSAYNYSFDNQFFPNPNDGWPSINLKTYSYIYNVALRIYGENSVVGNLLKNIENNKLPRTPLPLSKPYYIGEMSFERMLLNTNVNFDKYEIVNQKTQNYPNSNFAMLRAGKMNVFVKYGLNGPSHAHPDLINIEVMHGSKLLSRDLSNAGYRARLCNEWHRTSLAHNTVVINGNNITSTSPGETIYYDGSKIEAQHKNIYAGVDYNRCISITTNSVNDIYTVKALKEVNMDYVFHLECDTKLVGDYALTVSDLGYKNNGYQHILETKKLNSKDNEIVLNFVQGNKNIEISLNNDCETFICKSMDNPVNQTRTTIIQRYKGEEHKFKMNMKVSE